MTQLAAELQQVSGASTLYIFFGGMAAGIAIPPFEFYRAAQILDTHRLFLRDFSQSWYHQGLAGLTRDIPSTAVYLRNQITKLAPRRTVLVGNSMGGFAALLFATLLGEVEVIAFAPQTFISPWLRWKHHDGRWPRQIHRTWRTSCYRAHCWDLRPRLQRGEGVTASIYVSPMDRLDGLHAMRLARVQGVRVHEFAQGGHDVVKALRDAGKLAAVMTGGEA